MKKPLFPWKLRVFDLRILTGREDSNLTLCDRQKVAFLPRFLWSKRIFGKSPALKFGAEIQPISRSPTWDLIRQRPLRLLKRVLTFPTRIGGNHQSVRTNSAVDEFSNVAKSWNAASGNGLKSILAI